MGFIIHAVGDDIEVFAGDIDRRTVRQMAAVRQTHTHHGIAGREQREEDRQVGACARVRLDVGMFGAEELLRAVAGDVLDDVDILAAAVIALAGIALCIFIGQNGAGCQQHRLGDDVLAGNQLNVIALALQLQTGCVVNLFIVFCKLIQKEHGNSAILSSIAVL